MERPRARRPWRAARRDGRSGHRRRGAKHQPLLVRRRPGRRRASGSRRTACSRAGRRAGRPARTTSGRCCAARPPRPPVRPPSGQRPAAHVARGRTPSRTRPAPCRPAAARTPRGEGTFTSWSPLSLLHGRLAGDEEDTTATAAEPITPRSQFGPGPEEKSVPGRRVRRRPRALAQRPVTRRAARSCRSSGWLSR